MIDFHKFSILSVLGKEAGKMIEHEYPRYVLSNYEGFLSKIKTERAKATQNRNNISELYL